MPARRCISVSRSPSVRSTPAIWLASQSVGQVVSRAMWPKTRAQRRAWVSSASLRKSGIWQASHSSRTRLRPCASCADVGFAGQGGEGFQVGGVVAAHQARAWRRRGQAGEQGVDVAEVQVAVAPAELLQRVEAVGLDRGHASSSGIGGQSAVVPKVPSRMPRPARPAIWAISAAVRRRGRWPSMLRPGGRRRRGRRPCSGPCRSHRWRPGSRPPSPDRARPGRCGCAARAGPSPRRSRRGGGGSARRWRRPRRPRTRRRRCAAAVSVSLAGPAKSSCDRRGRVSISACGTRRCSSGRMVSAPRNMVSTRPRACSRRSVKTWPRSGSAQSWISSTATNSAGRSSGMASTVQENQRASGRDDLFLAGDQGDGAGALLGDHAVVVLAGEQAEREADDAGRMRQQPLDREMCLAGVGGPEDGFDARGESGHGGDGWVWARGMQVAVPGLEAGCWRLAGRGGESG